VENKQKYRALCEEENIRIFSQWWWLDAVAGENWDVVLLERESQIIASFPYFPRKKLIFNTITMPKLTPYFSIWIRIPENMKYSSQLYYEKEVYTEIVGKIPKVDHFVCFFDYSFTNWLPFLWKGYKQTTYYSYVIDNIKDLDTVYGDFNSNIKRNIKKASKLIEVSHDENIETFYEINKLSFDRQGLSIPYSFDYLKRIDAECQKRKCSKILIAKDQEGNIHAGVYIVWDQESAYYLMGGADPKFRNSGAATLLLWEAIKFSSQHTNKFDFEGSIIPPIEEYFRSFGGQPKPYSKVSATRSRLLKFREFFQELRKVREQ